MTGTAPFPAGFGATVHFKWPTSPNWQLLGVLMNEKPSAVFKLKQQKQFGSTADMMAEDVNVPAQIGISIEPVDLVRTLMMKKKLITKFLIEINKEQLTLTPSNSTDQVMDLGANKDLNSLIMKILENFYNYCSGFSTNLPPNAQALFGLNWSNTYIPLKALSEWYEKITRKLKADPTGNFLQQV
ncbi:hypothetical protein HK099_000086 [Clydaea vesicula]|uniref:Hikeshi-like domain-containing protein n=1 Tax=Clydaea vesicula TaxID=447962 RepID=A0AAD5U4R7_9FUNG|nr:hypothetical protein HK099_000086 [Clydaea vesicula]KAJ3386982.1 hypothetical protein HDU92_002181 [Lobulomyces angularis]